MTFNKFAAGRKVYGQGSTAPTRGQVDPSGYIKRELARRSTQHGASRTGNDGQSDTRSGLAHRAIQNNLGNNAARPQAGGLKQPPRQSGMVSQPGQRNKNPLPTVPTGTGQVHHNAVNPNTITPPAIQVSQNGQLNLPYDSEFYAQAMDAQQSFDAENLQLQQEDQERALAYEQFSKELEKSYVDRQRGTLGNSAGRGTLYSSAHTTAVNEDTGDYTTAKNNALAADQMQQGSITARRNQAQAYLNQMLQRATQGYADSLADSAGSLGFGSSGDDGMAGMAAALPGAPIANSLGNNVGRPRASTLTPPKPPKMVSQPHKNNDDDGKKKKKGKK